MRVLAFLRILVLIIMAFAWKVNLQRHQGTVRNFFAKPDKTTQEKRRAFALASRQNGRCTMDLKAWRSGTKRMIG